MIFSDDALRVSKSRPLALVAYGALGVSAGSFQCSLMSELPIGDIAARLRTTIEAAGLWVLHEIDPQALLDRGGYAIGAARQLLFFHPDLMARLLAADPNALLEAPLKFAIFEFPGEGTALRWADPTSSFARYNNSVLAGLGRELATTCHGIAAAALGQDGPVSA